MLEENEHNQDPSQEIDIAALQNMVNGPAASSRWLTITQPMIDAFADATFDRQFIHVDPVRAAAETSFGGTIAHGFLTLSLLSHMASEAMPKLKGGTTAVNYGFDRVRFVAPVKSGEALRGHFTLIEMSMRGNGEWQLKYQVIVEIRGRDKPALFADWLVLVMVTEDGAA